MRRLLMPLLALLLLSAPACGDSTTTFIGGGGDASGGDTNTGGDEDASPAEDAGVAEDAGAGEDAAAVGTPGDDELVWIYEQTPVFFSGWEEGQNQRQVDVTVTLPGEEFTYESIEFAFALGCPNGDRCDFWDRLGSVGLVQNAGTEEEVYIELSRYITPYRIAANWQADVTDLRPLLTGEVTFRVFIDTWVGPGHPNGDGLLVDATLDYRGGTPARPVRDVLPVLPMTRIVYGDPARPLVEQLPRFDVEVPSDASGLALRTFITGHGQGNYLNCAEFCPQDHSFTVNNTPHTREVWRDDCNSSVPQNQAGNVTSPRAGWCPGGITNDWTIDLGAPPSDGVLSMGYDVSEYVNTCRPDSPSCEGCAFNQGCEWNDSNHTEPNYQVSAALIVYE